MKVGIVIPSFLRGRGGAERIAAQVASLIVSEGEEACIVCHPANGTELPYDLDPAVGLQVVDCKHPKEEIAKQGYDLLVCFVMGGFFAAAVHIARVAGCPLIIQECTNPNRMAMLLAMSEEANDARSAFWLRQAVFAHAAAIRLTTPGYVDSLMPELRCFAYGFYNSIVVPEKGDVATRRKIVCVGALKTRNKNGLAAVEAFCRTASELDGWELHLYGLNALKQWVDAITARYPFAKVVDHGLVGNIHAIYADAYGLMIPSYDEGFPNVVVEAFSFGVPCIGFSDCLGVNELIRHGKTGYLADRAKPGDLAAALGALCRDEVARARMGENARRFAEEHLAYDRWAGEWMRLIRNAALGKDANGNSAMPPALRSTPRARLWRDLLDFGAS